MTITNQLKKICESLGKNNNPAYAVMAIATVKGICRPTFTMMDKTEKPETKKYTALREGLTEAIAIPSYWGTAKLAGNLSKYIKGGTDKQVLAKKNLMFMGVCIAALFIIPAACSIAIKPFENLIKGGKKSENKTEPNSINKLDTGSTNELQQEIVKPIIPTPINNAPKMANFAMTKVQPSMKVGAV